MIKGIIMQVEAESTLGYNSKMAPETKTTRGRLFYTLARSRVSSAMKSAFCEPSRSIATSPVSLNSIKELPNWHGNYSTFPQLTSDTEFFPTNSNKNIMQIFSSLMPHSTANLKKYSVDDLNNNSWTKRTHMMAQKSILERLKGIGIHEQKSLISGSPVVSIDNMKCASEMDMHNKTSLVMEHVAPNSSFCSSECVNEWDSAMDIASASCCEQGGGIEAAIETTTGVGSVHGLPSQPSTGTCQDGTDSLSETKSSSPPISSFNCTSGPCGEELTDHTSLQNRERSRTPHAPVLVSKATSVCGHHKKKTRPSSKKRHRRKRQRGVEDPSKAAKDETRSKNIISAGNTTSNDVLSFMKDLTDSIDIAEHHLFSSKKAASPSSASVCSLFISASELFDEADSDLEDFQNCSDDEIDFTLSDTSSFAPLLSSSDLILDEIGCTFVFDVTSPCSSGPDAECESQSDDKKLWIDPEVQKLLDDANKKWEENYGYVDIDEEFQHKKVQFPSEESDLQTVFILSPDDASKEARIGHWHVFARDRQRFRHRIAETERAIGYCLEPVHREKMHQQLYGQ